MSNYYDNSLFDALERVLQRVEVLERKVAEMGGQRRLIGNAITGVSNGDLPTEDEITELQLVDTYSHIYVQQLKTKPGQRPRLYVKRVGRTKAQ